jgi:two-component system cell cycle sensor histidine kinase/response regulator CckA
MAEAIQILMVEDSDDDAELLQRALERGGLDVQFGRVQTEEAMRRSLQEGRWDLIISDYSMPHFNGLSAFSLMKQSGLEIPFIFVSGTLGEETAVEAMRLGVSDYIVKGNLLRLVPAIRRELDKREDLRKRREAEAATQRMSLELRQAQKMEAIGRLAGGVAHDFNNLLTVVLGHATLLAEGEVSVEQQRQSLVEIRRCAERGSALTRQLMAFGRRQPLTRKATELNRIIIQFSAMLRRLIGDQVELEIKTAAGLPQVMADPNQVEQILMNLCLNARDAMPRGGRIQIQTAREELSALDLAGSPGLEPGPYAMLMVKDNGHGMSEDLLQHIFEPFFTTKGEGQGSGLGLSTVYGIVRQSLGHLRVESEPDRGSSFRIYLPLAGSGAPQEAPEASAGPAPSGDLLGSETILVAEDDDALRHLIEVILGRFGYQVISATNGLDAMKAFESQAGRIDLLLTDLNMPGMTGRDLAKKVREMRPGCRVLAMTGYAQPGVFEGMESEGLLVMTKPFNAQMLGARIRAVLKAEPRG